MSSNYGDFGVEVRGAAIQLFVDRGCCFNAKVCGRLLQTGVANAFFVIQCWQRRQDL